MIWPRRPRYCSVLSTPNLVLKWVDKTNAKLAAIDSAAWTDEEKAAFAAALGELKKTILALLKTKSANLA